MGGFEITQRTSDGYFDANAPLVQWNSNEQNTRRRMDKFLETETTKEFVLEIAKNNESQSADNQLWSKSTNAENQIDIKKKGRMTINGKTPDKVWMHPFLFIDFAMWISPSFKYDVTKFVYDELINYRNEAGDAYGEMAITIVMRKFRQ